jgi:hypothetical protein
MKPDTLIENSSLIYYRDRDGIIQDGNQWIDDYKHGSITILHLESLEEVYWSSKNQAWLKENV